MSLKVPQFHSSEHSIHHNLWKGKKVEALVLLTEKDTLQSFEFLDKVFRSVDKSFEKEVQWMKIEEGQSFHLGPLLAKNSFRLVFFFGVSPQQLGMGVQMNFFQSLSLGQVRLVFLPQVASFENNKTLKLNLWNSLKTIYQLQG
jgi:hypothetical protein